MVAAHVGRMAQIVTYNLLGYSLHPHSCDYIFRYYTTNFGLVLYHLIALPEFEVKPKTNRTSFSYGTYSYVGSTMVVSRAPRRPRMTKVAREDLLVRTFTHPSTQFSRGGS